MKTSYFTTPRRMDDATFHTWADPIERDPSGSSTHVADLLMAFMAVACLVGWVLL